MELTYGLISSDSHAQPDRDAFTSRMSKKRWGDDIPHVVETVPAGAKDYDGDPGAANSNLWDIRDGGRNVGLAVERWSVKGRIVGNRGVVNCPTVMDDPLRKYFPQRWEEVPSLVYDPIARLAALDRDGVDAEVLFPNDPVQEGTFFYDDPEFELACVRAYNDWLASWREASPRYVPLALIPYLSDLDVAIAEVKHAMDIGHRGVVMLAEPSRSLPGLKHFNDPYWDPFWAACQDFGAHIHWHGRGGLKVDMPAWPEFNPNQMQAIAGAERLAHQAQFIPNLLFTSVLERYPNLKFVCAETGIGWVNYVLEACDHEWERRHLWTEGVKSRPSDLFRRQVYVDFWYEEAGIQLRHHVGIDNIMWESDYPHSTSTYPDSQSFVERSLKDVPDGEREKLRHGNAARLYRL